MKERNEMGNNGTDFNLISKSDGDASEIEFAGEFEGEPVMWRAKVRVLRPGERSFISVGDVRNGTRLISVGLPLPRIDRPALVSTVIMIRQYRGLRRGYHAFGEMR
jgi:hypothetical protein